MSTYISRYYGNYMATFKQPNMLKPSNQPVEGEFRRGCAGSSG